MFYKEPQGYKAYHLFLIQNLCIHAGIGCQELAIAKNFYSIHKLLRAYCNKDDRIELSYSLRFPNCHHLMQG